MKKFLIFVCVIVLAVSVLVIPAFADDDFTVEELDVYKRTIMEHYNLSGDLDDWNLLAVHFELFDYLYLMPASFVPSVTTYDSVNNILDVIGSYQLNVHRSDGIITLFTYPSGFYSSGSNLPDIYYSDVNVLDARPGHDSEVFFSQTERLTLLEKLTLQAGTVTTTIAGSLESLVPLGVGLLALLIGCVLLRRVLPRFLP